MGRHTKPKPQKILLNVGPGRGADKKIIAYDRYPDPAPRAPRMPYTECQPVKSQALQAMRLAPRKGRRVVLEAVKMLREPSRKERLPSKQHKVATDYSKPRELLAKKEG